MPMFVNEYEDFDEEDEDQYEELRQILAPEYADLPDEEIETLFEQTFGIDPQDVEISLRQIGRGLRHVGQVAAPFLPTALGAVGTAVGGPVGGAIGGVAGSVLAQQLAPPTAPRRPPLGPRRRLVHLGPRQCPWPSPQGRAAPRHRFRPRVPSCFSS